MDWWETEELAAAILGMDEESDSSEIENAFFDKFEVSLEQFHSIVIALTPFTIPAVAAISGESFQGFVKDGAFICKQAVKA